MIEGFFGSKGELYFDIDLITDLGETITVAALLDTGFTDWLGMNTQDVVGLGWQELERREMTTALGEGEFSIYEGRVVFDIEESIIPVVVGDEIVEVLLGLKWLEVGRLSVDKKRNSLILDYGGD
jgi:clan AA aspartic protease